MKYITTKTEDGKTEIFTFPRSVPHSVMAEAIARLKNATHGEWKRITRTPVSAGFIEGGVCHGESESLHLRSRPHEDTILLRETGPESDAVDLHFPDSRTT